MKLYHFFSSKFKSKKETRRRKVVSTGTATLALTAGFWMFGGIADRALPEFAPIETEGSVAVEQAPETAVPLRGLSRKRKDFDKALDILANAATSDARLTDYLGRVQKRVTGEAAPAEGGSGVRVVKRAGKNAQTARLNTLAASETAAATAEAPQTKNVWAKLKSYFASPMVTDSRSAVSEAQPSGAAVKQAASASNGLTTGDVKFDTNPAIERWVNYYTVSEGGRRTMQIGIRRSDSYIDMARAEFRRMGIPEDLVWLAHVESVWHSTAISHAAAGGLWQFIPRTATDYGLTVSPGYDERLEPSKQTRVAAVYLRDLYTIFGDWTLAMAAYNCGEPRVMEAVAKNGRANFWEIHDKQLLPKETLNYVPKILAAISVADRAESYGFERDAE